MHRETYRLRVGWVKCFCVMFKFLKYSSFGGFIFDMLKSMGFGNLDRCFSDSRQFDSAYEGWFV